jgi:hypothetical protein
LNHDVEAALDRLDQLPSADLPEAQSILSSISLLLEARGGDPDGIEWLIEQLGPIVEPWAVRAVLAELSPADHQAIVTRLARAAVTHQDVATVLHVLRNAHPVLVAAVMPAILERAVAYGDSELPSLMYALEDAIRFGGVAGQDLLKHPGLEVAIDKACSSGSWQASAAGSRLRAVVLPGLARGGES